MFKLIIFGLFLILNKQIRAQNAAIKLNVDVLYESLCPDSRNFITKQLYPVWKEVAPFVNLKLVPFGKSASLENGTKFVCQHGPDECQGNRIQSCALEIITDQTLQVEYVNCFMHNFAGSDANRAQICGEKVGVNPETLGQCYSTATGTNLQLLAEKQTANIAPKFVPTILYNGKFDQQLQDNSLIDFKGVVCYLISQTNPNACESPSIVRL